MKRVSWSSDIVEHTRTSAPPVTSVGTFLAYLATHGTSQNTCMRALELFSTRATSLTGRSMEMQNVVTRLG